MIRIIIFASGSGTNAENLIKYFSNSKIATVVEVMTNNKNAGVIDRCARLKVPSTIFDAKDMVLDSFQEDLAKDADLIVLAGFLRKIPQGIIELFKDRIINIHPALLPKYGGKGMYGMHVHQAVVDNGESETGISIHLVNEHYDEGAILFQAAIGVDPGDSPEDVAQKIHGLEYQPFPRIIEEYINTMDHG